MQRLFFDWHEPFLPQVVRYLIERHLRRKSLDLSNALIALPGKAALRRLEALLTAAIEKKVADRSIDPDWLAPELVTVGRLPETLYAAKRAFADLTVSCLAWRRAIREMREEEPARLSAFLPQNIDDGFSTLTDLAQLVMRPDRELAAAGYDFQQVASSQFLIPEERLRWSVLAELQERYWAILDSAQVWDIQRARNVAVRRNECRTQKSIFVAGAIDLNLTLKKMLEQVADRVTILAFAPEEFADRYDEFGCVLADKWDDVVFDIPKAQIFKTASPVGEGVIASRLADDLNHKPGEAPLCRRLAIGVADEEVRPFLEQELAARGFDVDSAAGLDPEENRVVRLLKSTARFLKRREFDAFAELVRMADFQRYLLRAEPAIASGDWLSALDRHQKNYVPDELPPQYGQETESASDEEPEWRRRDLVNRQALRTVCQAVDRLLLPLTSDISAATSETGKTTEKTEAVESVESVLSRSDQVRRAMTRRLLPAEWIAPLDDFIAAVYPQRSEAPSEAERQVDAGIKELHDFFASLSLIPSSLAEPVALDELTDLFSRRLKNVRLATPSSTEALELLGWLDLALDDRPELIIAGFCDEYIPSSRLADLFLPDRCRSRLSLENNRSRAARDAALLMSILANRPETRFLFARTSLCADPLRPSRFLLMTSDKEETARRILSFFSDSDTPNPNLPSDAAACSSARSSFSAPILRMEGPVPDSFAVSSFKLFLETPYVWFLQRALNLERLSDQASELGPDLFGSLIHRALEAFGRDETVRRSNDPEIIAAFLDRQADRAARQYRRNRSAGTVLIQVELARGRLRQFAQWQARWRSAGNEILFAETTSAQPFRLAVDKEPVTISGQIDRIDYNAALDRYYVFDYKTFDTALQGKAPDSGETFGGLLNLRPDNLIAAKYWKNFSYPPVLGAPNILENPVATSGVGRSANKWRHWVDLQLPLYLPLAKQILAESGRTVSQIQAGYIALPKSGAVGAYAADWSHGDLAEADATFEWAIRSIRRLWRDGVDPLALIDPANPARGILLPKTLPAYLNDYSAIAFS